MEAPKVKARVMRFTARQGMSHQFMNGDEQLFSDFRGNFGKGLMHEGSGFITPSAYVSLLFALENGQSADFDNITLGTGTVKLVNPQGSLSFSLPAYDGWFNVISQAPTFISAETAGEMVELYWTVLVRDVNFNDFGTNGTVGSAVTELNTLTDFRGPKVGGVVTTGSFLRGNTPGDLLGPYISQFLYQAVPYGATTIPAVYTVPNSGTGNDFITSLADWLTVANGGATGNTITYDGTQRFIRTPRDLSEFVHQDFPGQSFLGALLLLNSYGTNALDTNNPYRTNTTQDGFVTYGIAHYMELLVEAIEEGLKAAWYQKWQVNRRARPEEYGFYVHRQVADSTPLGISTELTGSTALANNFTNNGTYFLPQAYPEGSPTHPSYPAGHAVLSGACVTILKALFNESFQIPSPLEPNAGNTALVAFGSTLTVGNELNKLAANISLGRDHAGVHYRSDGTQGLLLGEKIAIDILNNGSFLHNENFAGFSLTKFDGTTIIVGGKR